MYLMFRSENPFTSGSSLRMSRARRGITAAPQPSRFWRSAIIRPISQYIRIISPLAESVALTCAVRIRVLISVSKTG